MSCRQAQSWQGQGGVVKVLRGLHSAVLQKQGIISTAPGTLAGRPASQSSLALLDLAMHLPGSGQCAAHWAGSAWFLRGCVEQLRKDGDSEGGGGEEEERGRHWRSRPRLALPL
jgi:hypothetical protein